MSSFKIVITDNLFPHVDEERALIEKAGAELVVYRSLEGSALKDAVKDADAVLVNQAKITADVIGAMQKCRVISRYGVGYDNVDVDAARKKGIAVAIVPGYCRYEVAEHAAALLYACARSVPARDRAVRAGHWRDDVSPVNYRIRGSVLGIVGWGDTGRAFYEQMKSAGFSRILVATRSSYELDAPPPVKRASLEKILRSSDYISLHIPLNDETRHLINADTLSMMKETAVLINTSRGGIVDEKALIYALQEGRLRAAGLDVIENESPGTKNRLFEIPGAVLTDHRAYYSEESLSELKRRTAANALAVLAGLPADSLL